MPSGNQSSYAVAKSHLIPQWVSENTFRRHGIEIQRASGVYLYDSEGRPVIDFYSQVMATNLGHALPILTDALQKQANQVAFLNTIKFVHPIVTNYTQKLASLLPENINRIFFTVSGAESTETAIKVARQVTGRKKVLYRQRSYHGASYAALSFSGDPRQKIIDGFNVPYAVPIPHPGHHDPKTHPVDVNDYISQVETIINTEGPETVACLIVETVTGGSGMLMPAPGMFQRLRGLADKYGFLIIADEVMTGFGRTGTMWAFEQENYVPDIITMAKGINNGTCPLGAVAIGDHIVSHYQDKPFPHGATNSTHLLSIATADATLDYLLSNRVIEGVKEKEALLCARLQALCEKGLAKSFRLRGLMGAIALHPMDSNGSGILFMNNTKILDSLYKRGLYTLMKDDLLLIGPPLTISEKELNEAVDAIEYVLVSIQSGGTQKSGVLLNQTQMWDAVTVDQWRATTNKLDYAYDSAVTYIRNLVRNPESALILEIGSGTGEMISQFQNSFGSCWGVEFQKDFAQACQVSHPSINIIQGDAKNLTQLLPSNFATDSNEVLFICLTNTLGNMSSSDMYEIVQEMVSTLPDRGEVVLGFTAKQYFDSVVRSVFQTNPVLFGDVSRNDQTGEVTTSTGYYSKFYDKDELAKLLGEGWRFETVDKTIYCHYAKPARKAQLYYDDERNLEIHSVLGNNEMHVGLYTEVPASDAPSVVERGAMVEAEMKATGKLLDMSNITEDTVIAEFGSGFGNAANLALSRETAPACFYCIDISASNLDIARKVNSRHPQEKVKYLVRDFADTGLPEKSVDVVLSQDSLLHASAVMDRVLNEAARILKPGGRLIFTDIMQSPDVQLSAPLAERLGMKSLLCPESYKKLAHNAGLKFSRFDDMSHNILLHYSSFQNQVSCHVDSEKVSSSYIDRYAKRLQVWIDSANDLRWGFMEFMKLPPNCRLIKYPWVHFMNHCDIENHEHFRIRTALGPVVKPSDTSVNSDSFTITWNDSSPPTTIKFGVQNEFLEDVIFWGVDSASMSEKSVTCWITDVKLGVTITHPIPSLISTVQPTDTSLDFVELKNGVEEHFKKLTGAGLEMREMPVEIYSFLNRESAISAIGWHTDNPFDYDTPQFVCLYGKTVNEATPTYFAKSDSVIEKLKQDYPEQYNLLKNHPLYMARVIPSSEHDMNLSIVPRNVVNESGDVFLSCITQRVPSQSEVCTGIYEALNTLERICEQMRFVVHIREGEAVCFNNQHYFHRRPAVNSGRIIKYTSFHSPAQDKLGVIGLGTMGLPLSNHLADLSAAGKVNGKVGGFDIDFKSISHHLNANVARHESVGALCNETDTVFMFLPDDSSTMSCIQEIVNTPHPRSRLVINMGTTSPECSRKLEELLNSVGHEFCEAPVSGGPAAVGKGQVTIMFACNSTAYMRAKTILRTVSPNLIFCGATGTASVIKLCNNFCVAGNMLGFSTAAKAAKAMGCSGSLLSQVLNKSTGRSWCSEVHNPIPGVKSTAPGSNEYRPGFRASHMSKDVGIFTESATNVGIKSELMGTIKDAYKSTADKNPALDFSSVFTHVQ